MTFHGFIFALVFGLAGFAHAQGTTPPKPDPAQELAQARVKIAIAARTARAKAQTPAEKAIVEADLAFAAEAAKVGAATAFSLRMHPQGKMFPPRQPIAVGPEAVKALFADDNARWEWAPVEFVASGDLGVTWGIAAISGKDEKGAPFTVTTRYTTVWRKNTAGEWQIWIDVGTPGPLPEVQ